MAEWKLMRGHYEMFKNVIIGILVGLLSAACAGFGIQTYRLGRTESELGHIRTELSAAQNRQREIADIIRRDSELLSESGTSIKFIREQLEIIRESYEEMEKLLLDNDGNCGGRGNYNLDYN